VSWRLVRIDYSGPHGSTVDPFYQARSTGLLIYDKSGWIERGHRRAGADQVRGSEPTNRITNDANLAASMVLAFDSYYAYHGTWDSTAKSSEVAHHVSSSLSPRRERHDLHAEGLVRKGDRLILQTGAARRVKRPFGAKSGSV